MKVRCINKNFPKSKASKVKDVEMTKKEIATLLSSKDSKSMAKALNVNGTKYNKLCAGEISDEYLPILEEKIKSLDLVNIPGVVKKESKITDELLITVADSSSRTAASKKLGLSQSSFNKKINDREFPTDPEERLKWYKALKTSPSNRKIPCDPRLLNYSQKSVQEKLKELGNDVQYATINDWYRNGTIAKQYIPVIKKILDNPDGLSPRMEFHSADEKKARAKEIKEIIKEYGLQYKSIAACTGINESRLSSMSRGSVYATDSEIAILKDALKIASGKAARDSKYDYVRERYSDKLHEFMEKYGNGAIYSVIPTFNDFMVAAKKFDSSVAKYFNLEGVSFEKNELDTVIDRIKYGMSIVAPSEKNYFDRDTIETMNMSTIIWYSDKYRIDLDWILVGQNKHTNILSPKTVEKSEKPLKQIINDEEYNSIKDELIEWVMVEKSNMNPNAVELRLTKNLFSSYKYYWRGDQMFEISRAITLSLKGTGNAYVNKSSGWLIIVIKGQKKEASPAPEIKVEVPDYHWLAKLTSNESVGATFNVITLDDVDSDITRIRKVGSVKIDSKIDDVYLLVGKVPATKYFPIYIGSELVAFTPNEVK